MPTSASDPPRLPSRRAAVRSGSRALCGGIFALTTAVLAACAANGPTAPGASIGQQADLTLPAAVRHATLVSSSGTRFDLAGLTGKVVVISDMMTLCQETCPLDTANVVAAARSVEHAGLGDRITFLSITIDPRRDTPLRLAAYRRLYGAAPADWMLATGTPGALTALWKALGVFIQKVRDAHPAPKDWLTGKPLTYDLTHSDEVFFFDRKGRERYLLEGAAHVAGGAPLPQTLRTFLDASGRANLNHPGSEAWTLPQEMRVISWLAGRQIGAAAS